MRANCQAYKRISNAGALLSSAIQCFLPFFCYMLVSRCDTSARRRASSLSLLPVGDAAKQAQVVQFVPGSLHVDGIQLRSHGAATGTMFRVPNCDQR